jgi:glycosyltransferase involved in cell wall biosynthesis
MSGRASGEARRPSVVIAHDFTETYGGAERVTEVIARAFPDAPVFAIAGRPGVAERMGLGDRLQTILPPRRGLLRHYRLATPVLPLAVRMKRLPVADVLVTSSYAFALRFRTRNDAPQLCYCHSPLRFAWSMTGSYRDTWAGDPVRGAAFDALAAAMRRGDRRAAQSVAGFVTQSPFVAEQIERFYGREAEVVGAPIDCERFHPAEQPERAGDYYLFCGRLIEPYKRVRETVEAFASLPHRLVVAGDGPALEMLRGIATDNVEFTGELADAELVPLMQRCRALVFPSRDDFGLLPLEVMACGRPVIAYSGGGARYTVVPGLTGELFDDQSASAIAAAVEGFDPAAYDPARIRKHAEQWDVPPFRERIEAAVGALAG